MYRVARHCVRAYNPNSLVCVCVCRSGPFGLPGTVQKEVEDGAKSPLRPFTLTQSSSRRKGKKKIVSSDETAIIHNAIQRISLLNTFVCVCVCVVPFYLFYFFFVVVLQLSSFRLFRIICQWEIQRGWRNNQKFLTPFFFLLLFLLPHRWIYWMVYIEIPRRYRR